MKRIFGLILGVAVAVSLFAFAFTYWQNYQEQNLLLDDLSRHSALLAESFKEAIEPNYSIKKNPALDKLLDKDAGKERLTGLVIYDVTGALVASSSTISKGAINFAAVAEAAIKGDTTVRQVSSVDGDKLFVLADPLHSDGAVTGALVVVQNANYLDAVAGEVWTTNLVRLFVQVLVFLIAIILLLRWLIFQPMKHILESIRQIRTGTISDELTKLKVYGFFHPIAVEIAKMSESLLNARQAASEEARLRLEKLDTPWTAERLKEFIKHNLKGRPIIVVSNREPYSHSKVDGEITYSVPSSGLVTALEPIMEACGGLWVAHGSGDADKEVVDSNDKVALPPDEPKYTLKRIWLSEKEVKGHYVGFSNEALWPLCHMVHTRPVFRKNDWLEYRKVNGKFAQSLLAEIKDMEQPIILVQDYHFALLPAMIKKSRPDAEVGIFWHIPWPGAEAFNICPWRKAIVEGMLGADVVGFHTQQYCNNFLDTARKEIESIVDIEQFSVTHDGHTSYIKPLPISVALTNVAAKKTQQKSLVLQEAGVKTKYVAVGVDRMDYTKGILERLRGLEFFFETHPSYQEELTFVQVAPLSRQSVEKYRQFAEEVRTEVERINEKFGTSAWTPIVLIDRNLTHEELDPLYQVADVCLVTPLNDGMNLVAKEYVAAQDDESGVLVLSKFTGAARDLKDALIINPYSAEETSEAIYQALTMSQLEQRRRIKKMRESIKNKNIYRWAAELIRAVANLGSNEISL
ncbi:trehalose-6-phosphate synthase [Candidatus Uhrbacteria bacterium CG10_big_fil_rev_8_21_14_0_10_48_11]|uniref:Trehalose-6-phosphate synthase n=1 Tax=Candidatus Uhrbacteria bacterium CG10_big_fil_rev_8_21_14_0_10_48_11 TaxID=1975037 RepID=A0A2M8LE17_9BACT|nr:MAG: trehalose-6-phosphate synthase [Candidatus Uhrbacteria bacterium CG10_big_fil_rev_8_21_14_0_10_48_11]